MSQGERLTRQELSWLLTQEARTAAQTLRRGVAALSNQPVSEPPPAPEVIETSLNTLDDAMRMLASLNKSMAHRGVHGRIDLAALVCEVAPNARVHLEPGSGTEVAGDEAHLRRMMQVLLAQTSGVNAVAEGEVPEVWIRRQGDQVRVSVALGPDTGAGSTSERAWLNRMALRYGGHLELEGKQESLVIPAEGAIERSEVEALRKELEAAQQQGEAYARELAAVFAAGGESALPPSTMPPPSESLTPMSAMTSAIVDQLRAVAAGLARDGTDVSSLPEGMQSCVFELSELVSDLSRFSRVRAHELPAIADVAQLAREAVQDCDARAARYDITLSLQVADQLQALVRTSALRAVLRLLIDHGIAATPRGSTVSIAVSVDRNNVCIEVDDHGPSVPAGSRDALVWRRLDPANVGRPRGMHLLGAAAIVSNALGVLELEDAPGGGTRTRVVLGGI